MSSYVSMDDAYPDLIQKVDMWGGEFSPKGERCIEMRPYNFAIQHPTLILCRDKGRRLNYRFFAIETLGYIAGIGDDWYADLITRANSTFKRFRSPKGGELIGAYRPVIKKSMVEAAEVLHRDPYTRQAVVSLWSPGVHDKITCNTMCTLSLQFLTQVVRPDRCRLDIVTTMRSNDMDWGFPYDVPAFSSLLCAMAGVLVWDVGHYNHTAGSLHIYEDHRPNLSNEFIESRPLPIPYPKQNIGPKENMQVLQYACDDYLKTLHNHVTDGKKWSDFSYLGKRFPEGPGEEYWEYWNNLVRFKWSEE